MKASSNQVKGLVKFFRGISNTVIGTCILAPLVQMFSNDGTVVLSDYAPMFAIVVIITLLLLFLCWFLDGVADDLEQQEQLLVTTHKRKHRVRVPRNTTFSVEVEV